MKYFIGFLLQGESLKWHNKITRDISERFNTWKIYEKIPPHITIFYPESVTDMKDIRNYIKDWIQKNKISGDFHISGFDHFNDRVVFAKVDADQSVIKLIEDLREGIRKLSNINIKDESFPIWHPHSTLAYKLSPEEISKIWRYTKQLNKPSFTLPLNNLTIFKYTEDQIWVVDECFDF